MDKIILSICIPTFNRSQYLVRTIESLISQPEFLRQEVEIIISDNASTDGTNEAVKIYLNKYSNIKYFRNDRNVVDKNFPLSILRGNGVFRKLMNDTAIWQPNSLSHLVNCVSQNAVEKPVLSFTNGFLGDGLSVKCNSMNEFAARAIYWPTWIGSFGIWEEDQHLIEDIYNGVETKLWQVKQIYALAQLKNKCIVDDTHIINNVGGVRGGYNFYQIFAINFFDIVYPYVKTGISKKTYRKIKKSMMRENFVKWYLQILADRKNHKYDLSNSWQYLKKYFTLYEYISLLVLRFTMFIVMKVIRFVDKTVRFLWRRTINKWKMRKNGKKVPVFYSD
jgi:abequosyltransferase